jgi:hypothetical protein
MIEPLPSRPVARFMLPLADVMTVLFSLFLLLPHLERTGGEKVQTPPKLGGIWSPDEQLQARDELTRLRRLMELPTGERLQFVVMLIDEETGRLLLITSGSTAGTAIGSAEQLLSLVDEQRRGLSEGKKLLYILQVPGVPPGRLQRRHPTATDSDNYAAWFAACKVEYQIAGLSARLAEVR